MGGRLITDKPTSPNRPYRSNNYCAQDRTRVATPHPKKVQPKRTIYTKSSNGRATKAVQIAEREWDPYKNYEVNGRNKGPDITRYRYGTDDNTEWCASFYNYCFNPNHVKGQNAFGLSDKDVRSCGAIMRAAKKQGCFASVNDIKSGRQKVHVGDGIIWRSSDGKKGHIGIVVEVRSDGSFVTIQGNTDDHVQKIEYSSINDAMTRISDGVTETLQGFAQTATYYESRGIRASLDLQETPQDLYIRDDKPTMAFDA